jgi:hypothetical protein
MIDEIEETETETPTPTVKALAPVVAAPPVAPTSPVPAAVGDAGVRLTPKTGLQKVRGRLKTVTLPIHNIWIDDQLVGYVGNKPSVPVTLIREVTADEIPAIQAAVAAQKSEVAADVIVKTVPSGTL